VLAEQVLYAQLRGHRMGRSDVSMWDRPLHLETILRRNEDTTGENGADRVNRRIGQRRQVRHHRMRNLGSALDLLLDNAAESALRAELRSVWASTAASPAVEVATRIHAGRKLADVEMSAGAPDLALAALAAVVDMVLQLAPRALTRANREHGLSRLAGLASDVAAVAVAAGQLERAVELLEQTRGLLMAEAIGDRSDLSDLRQAAPALAREFDDLRQRATTSAGVEAAASRTDVMGEPNTTRPSRSARNAASRPSTGASLLGRIRATAGFEQFLRRRAWTSFTSRLPTARSSSCTAAAGVTAP
jgi:hypothetical protein